MSAGCETARCRPTAGRSVRPSGTHIRHQAMSSIHCGGAQKKKKKKTCRRWLDAALTANRVRMVENALRWDEIKPGLARIESEWDVARD